MSTEKADFHYSENVEPHRTRSRQILKKYPHVRNLIGTNPTTMLYILGIVAFQIAMAWAVRDQAWWVTVSRKKGGT